VLCKARSGAAVTLDIEPLQKALKADSFTPRVSAAKANKNQSPFTSSMPDILQEAEE